MSRCVLSLTLAAALAALVTLGPPLATPVVANQKEKDKDAKGGKEAVEVFKDKAGEYRWHVTDTDGKVVAMTPKGYDSKEECLKALAAVKATLAKAKVTDLTRDPAPKKDK